MQSLQAHWNGETGLIDVGGLHACLFALRSDRYRGPAEPCSGWKNISVELEI
ncbi:hypothetical protein [Parafilimonas sp.]|uniref:hypothetical protein n=1 Tax=Parafilimonas sp. TaxID=1969739 RepID=UPI0039E34267